MEETDNRRQPATPKKWEQKRQISRGGKLAPRTAIIIPELQNDNADTHGTSPEEEHRF